MPKVTEEHLQARRQQILDGAASCFADRGFHQTTMNDICQATDLSPGAIYRYFNGKEEIIEAMVDERRRQGMEHMKRAEERTDTIQALEETARVFFAKLEDPQGCALDIAIWSEAQSNPAVRARLRDSTREIRSAIATVVKQVQEHGIINPALDPEAVAEVHISFFEGLVLQRAIDPEVDIWKYLEVVRAITYGEFSRNGVGGGSEDGRPSS
ncbi:MAG: TetR/AcrR family transcriptional regulator [Dehalococcoidia bacterium]